MILFLYGADSFRSREKLRAIRERFLATPGGEVNYTRFVAGEFDAERFDEAIRSAPFLSRTRLVVVEGLLSEKPALVERILELISDASESTVLVFYEPDQPDRRGKGYQALLTAAQSEAFEPLEGRALTGWIRTRVKSEGGEITPPAADLLARSVGPDLWRMSHEIAKLVSYASPVTPETVERLVPPMEEGDVFSLVDAIGERRSRQALEILTGLLGRGENELRLLGMITRQFRNITLAKALLDEGATQPQVAAKLSLHRFVAEKACEQAQHFEPASLAEAYERLLETDLRFKSTTPEPGVVLSLLVAELCRV